MIFEDKKTSVLLFAVLLIFLGFFILTPSKEKPVDGKSPQISADKTVVFQCKDGKSITATFHTPDNAVDLVLSRGMEIHVPKAISASGARYANSNETFVFWNKGNTAFVTEGDKGQETYSNCLTK